MGIWEFLISNANLKTIFSSTAKVISISPNKNDNFTKIFHMNSKWIPYKYERRICGIIIIFSRSP